MQSALRSISIERPRRMTLALGAMALALGMAWATESLAQSSQSPSNAAPTVNRVVTPQAPGAVQNNAQQTMQPSGQGTEQKADAAKDKMKDKAKDKAKKASP